MTGIDPRVLELLERLPLDAESLDRIAQEAGVTDAASLAALQAANRHANVLSGLPRPIVPAPLRAPDFAARIVAAEGARAGDRLAPVLRSALGPVPAPAALRRRDFLQACHEDAVDAAADRLRHTPLGDALAEGLAPRTAPRDADWASVALEELEASHGPAAERVTFGERSRTPGWLWSRIRGDVRGRVVALRRRRSVRRLALATAALLVSVLVYTTVADVRWLHGGSTEPTIVFQRVDQPLSDQYSTAAVLRRIRDGR